MDLGSGLRGLFARFGAIWVKGWGVCWGCLRLGPGEGDGWVEAKSDYLIGLLS